MDDKMTKEVEKVYYVRKIEKLESKAKKDIKKVLILGISNSVLSLSGLKTNGIEFEIASLILLLGLIYYDTLYFINSIKGFIIDEKLKKLEEKEKIEHELKGLGEAEKMEGKTK